MSIGDNIKKIRSDNNLTQEEFGKIAGVSSMAVSQWENGRAVPRMGAIQRLADYFHVSKGDLIDEGEALGTVPLYSSGHATVPLVTLGAVHAGPFSDAGITERRIDVPASLLERHPRAQALVVEGDCMSRVVPPGLCVVYDPEVEPWNGSVAIVETEDYRALMRRWYRGSGTLMLVADSYSDGYEDIVLREEDGPVTVIGTVVWVQSADEMREG